VERHGGRKHVRLAVRRPLPLPARADGPEQLGRLLDQAPEIGLREAQRRRAPRLEQALQDGTPLREAWSRGIFGVWAATAEVRPLFDYVDATRKTERPLRITGMDAQMQVIQVLKNLAILGGLLAVTTRGAGAFSLDARSERASSDARTRPLTERTVASS